MSKKQYIGISILVVIVLGFGFYWFVYRPSQIKKYCFERAEDIIGLINAMKGSKSDDWGDFFYFYTECLMGKGGLRDNLK